MPPFRVRPSQPQSHSACAEVERQLAELRSRVGEALTIVDQAMRSNTANRPLVDALLDVKNSLTRK